MLFTVRDEDTDSAAVLDITGWHFSFKVKRRDEDTDASLVASGTATIINAAAGEVQIAVSSASTSAMLGDYRYSLWRTDTGAASCLSQGYFSVVDTTQDA